MSSVKTAVRGTETRPRLRATITNRHVIAQVIDDDKGHTLAYSTSMTADVNGSLNDKAAWVGEDIAKRAAKAGVKQVVFDRGSRRYHGRIKTLAETARNKGLEF